MQTEDAEIRKARETILPLFIDKYGHTKRALDGYAFGLKSKLEDDPNK